jgi:hypothetical protein
MFSRQKEIDTGMLIRHKISPVCREGISSKHFGKTYEAVVSLARSVTGFGENNLSFSARKECQP